MAGNVRTEYSTFLTKFIWGRGVGSDDDIVDYILYIHLL